MTAQGSPERCRGLDLLKFLCVFFMILLHTHVWLISSDDSLLEADNWLYEMIYRLLKNQWWVPLIYALPLCLPAAAGSSLRFAVDRQGVRGVSFASVIKTAVVLAVLSWMMNLVTSLSLEWDVLQFIAVSYIVTVGLLKFYGTIPVYCLGIFSLLVAPGLRSLFPLNDDIFLGLFIGTQERDIFWPLFPWFFTFVFGFAMGDLFDHFSRATFYKIALIVGVGLLFLSLFDSSRWFDLDPMNAWGPAVFQPPTSAVLGLMGLYSVLFGLCTFIGERTAWKPYGIVNAFSKGILWIYLGHTVIGVMLAQLFRTSLPVGLLAFLFPIFLLAASWGIGILVIVIASKRIEVAVSKVGG